MSCQHPECTWRFDHEQVAHGPDFPPGTRVPVVGVDFATGPDFTAETLFDAHGIIKDVRVSFSRWCRSGFVGDDKCLCGRCLKRRGGEVTEETEKLAELVGGMLDLAYQAGREMQSVVAKLNDLFKGHQKINHPASLPESLTERKPCKFGCDGYDRGNPFDPDDKDGWMCVWPDCESYYVMFETCDPGDEHQ